MYECCVCVCEQRVNSGNVINSLTFIERKDVPFTDQNCVPYIILCWVISSLVYFMHLAEIAQCKWCFQTCYCLESYWWSMFHCMSVYMYTCIQTHTCLYMCEWTRDLFYLADHAVAVKGAASKRAEYLGEQRPIREGPMWPRSTSAVEKAVQRVKAQLGLSAIFFISLSNVCSRWLYSLW